MEVTVALPTQIESAHRGVSYSRVMRFEHRGRNGYPMHCQVAQFHMNDDFEVFVLSELADNPGQSVTNAHETLVPEVFNALADAPAGKVQFLEHYGPFSYPDGTRKEQLTWLLTESDANGNLRSVGWAPMA